MIINNPVPNFIFPSDPRLTALHGGSVYMGLPKQDPKETAHHYEVRYRDPVTSQVKAVDTTSTINDKTVTYILLNKSGVPVLSDKNTTYQPLLYSNDAAVSDYTMVSMGLYDRNGNPVSITPEHGATVLTTNLMPWSPGSYSVPYQQYWVQPTDAQGNPSEEGYSVKSDTAQLMTSTPLLIQNGGPWIKIKDNAFWENAGDVKFQGVADGGEVQQAISDQADTGKQVTLSSNYKSTVATDIANKTLPVIVDGKGSKIEGGTQLPILNFKENSSVEVRNLKLERTPSATTDTGHMLVMIDQSDATVADMSINGISGTGSALISYPTSGQISNVTYRDINVSGDIALSLNTNGALITSVDGGIMNNIRADGIREFAVEYKNQTRNSLVSNFIVKNSKTGLGYGQDTLGTDDVSYCAATNGVVSASTVGIVVGDGKYNNFSNININSLGATTINGTAITGIRYSLDTEFCMSTGMLLSGNNMAEPIRYDNSNCFTSAMVVNNPGDTVILAPGASRNATELVHPGTKQTILNDILDNSGNPISGSLGNPFWCHATGEYRGTISGRWRYVHDNSGVNPAIGAHKFVLESKGTTLFNVLTDGAGESGYSMTTPSGVSGLTLSSAGDYLRLFTPTHAKRIYASTDRPETDGVMSLGTASNRYNTVYATDGAINTSDENLKLIDEIPQSWLDAAKIIKPIRFKWLNEIERFKNGDRNQDARWHIGYGAQSVFKALSDCGVENPWECAFLCKDALTEDLESGEVVPIVDDKGVQIERWGIRQAELNTLKIAAI